MVRAECRVGAELLDRDVERAVGREVDAALVGKHRLGTEPATLLARDRAEHDGDEHDGTEGDEEHGTTLVVPDACSKSKPELQHAHVTLRLTTTTSPMTVAPESTWTRSRCRLRSIAQFGRSANARLPARRIEVLHRHGERQRCREANGNIRVGVDVGLVENAGLGAGTTGQSWYAVAGERRISATRRASDSPCARLAFASDATTVEPMAPTRAAIAAPRIAIVMQISISDSPACDARARRVASRRALTPRARGATPRYTPTGRASTNSSGCLSAKWPRGSDIDHTTHPGRRENGSDQPIRRSASRSWCQPVVPRRYSSAVARRRNRWRSCSHV